MARLIYFVDGFSSASAPTLGAISGTTGAFSGNVTVGGTLGVTGVSTLTGNVGVGAAPTYALDIQTTGTTQMLRVVGSSTNNVLFQSGSANSQTLELRGGGGDSSLMFSVNSSTTPTFSIGVDNSDADKFKLSSGGTLGTTDRLVINTSGNMGFGADVNASSLVPYYFYKSQDSAAILCMENPNVGSSAYASLSVKSDSASGDLVATSAANGDYVEVVANSDSSGGLRINSSHASTARISMRIRSTEKFYIDNSGNAVAVGSVDAASYKVGGASGANFSGAVTNITVVNGIVTAAS